jgi:hypothetical protein
MPFNDKAIARELNRKYPEIKTAADARNARESALLQLRRSLLREGLADLAALPDHELCRLVAGLK